MCAGKSSRVKATECVKADSFLSSLTHPEGSTKSSQRPSKDARSRTYRRRPRARRARARRYFCVAWVQSLHPCAPLPAVWDPQQRLARYAASRNPSSDGRARSTYSRNPSSDGRARSTSSPGRIWSFGTRAQHELPPRGERPTDRHFGGDSGHRHRLRRGSGTLWATASAVIFPVPLFLFDTAWNIVRNSFGLRYSSQWRHRAR